MTTISRFFIYKKPLFLPEKEYLDFILETINSWKDISRGMAGLLWLASDHRHVYIKSDPVIIRKPKPFLKREIPPNFPEIKKAPDPQRILGDKAYSTETLG